MINQPKIALNTLNGVGASGNLGYVAQNPEMTISPEVYLQQSVQPDIFEKQAAEQPKSEEEHVPTWWEIPLETGKDFLRNAVIFGGPLALLNIGGIKAAEKMKDNSGVGYTTLLEGNATAWRENAQALQNLMKNKKIGWFEKAHRVLEGEEAFKARQEVNRGLQRSANGCKFRRSIWNILNDVKIGFGKLFGGGNKETLTVWSDNVTNVNQTMKNNLVSVLEKVAKEEGKTGKDASTYVRELLEKNPGEAQKKALEYLKNEQAKSLLKVQHAKELVGKSAEEAEKFISGKLKNLGPQGINKLIESGMAGIQGESRGFMSLLKKALPKGGGIKGAGMFALLGLAMSMGKLTDSKVSTGEKATELAKIGTDAAIATSAQGIFGAVGGTLGAAIGSLIGPVGTALGMSAGTIAGDFAAFALSSQLTEKVFSYFKKDKPQNEAGQNIQQPLQLQGIPHDGMSVTA